MENPLLKAYQVLDDSIMFAAESAAGAYNWTTGGTKDELANGLVTIGSAALCAGTYIIYTPYSIPASLLVLYNGHLTTTKNRIYARLEQDALNKDALNLEVEHKKNIGSFFGLQWLSGGVFFTAGYSLLNDKDIDVAFGFLISAAGSNALGAADYIMRTDYKPPRKNVLSRAGDIIAEAINEYRKPELQPVKVGN